MWNPFRSVKLEPVIPAQNTAAAIGPEKTDPAYVAEVERSKMRSLLARTQITTIHETLAERSPLARTQTTTIYETLAERSLFHMRGGT